MSTTATIIITTAGLVIDGLPRAVEAAYKIKEILEAQGTPARLLEVNAQAAATADQAIGQIEAWREDNPEPQAGG